MPTSDRPAVPVVGPRLALLGAGRWGRHYLRLVPALGAEIVVCCTRGPTVRAWLCEHHPTVGHTDSVEEALRAAVDGVVVATPRQTHVELTLAALRRGLHVLVEKPLAPDPATLERLRHTAASHGAVLMTGYTHCHDTSFRALCHVAGEGAATEWSLDWQNPRTATGPLDVAWEYLPHVLSMAVALAAPGGTGPGARCRVTVHGGGPGIDAVITTGTLLGRVRVRTSAPERRKRVVVCAADQILGAWTDRLLRVPGREVVHAAEEPLATQIRAFLEAVRGRSPRPSAIDLDGPVTELLTDAVAQLTDPDRLRTT
jgi:predicted dehydrogenase